MVSLLIKTDKPDSFRILIELTEPISKLYERIVKHVDFKASESRKELVVFIQGKRVQCDSPLPLMTLNAKDHDIVAVIGVNSFLNSKVSSPKEDKEVKEQNTIKHKEELQLKRQNLLKKLGFEETAVQQALLKNNHDLHKTVESLFQI